MQCSIKRFTLHVQAQVRAQLARYTATRSLPFFHPLQSHSASPWAQVPWVDRASFDLRCVALRCGVLRRGAVMALLIRAKLAMAMTWVLVVDASQTAQSPTVCVNSPAINVRSVGLITTGPFAVLACQVITLEDNGTRRQTETASKRFLTH